MPGAFVTEIKLPARKADLSPPFEPSLNMGEDIVAPGLLYFSFFTKVGVTNK